MSDELATCSVILRTKKPCGQPAQAYYDVEPPMLRHRKQKTRRNYLCAEHVHLIALLKGEPVYWMDGTEIFR
jgi:hypothetical protein